MKKLALSLIFSLIFSTVCFVAPTSAASCADFEVIYVRGSGRELNHPETVAFRAALEVNLSDLNYHFYELGETSQSGFQYPAVSVENFSTLLGAKISAGKAFSYGKSVTQGVEELKSYVSSLARTCPETKFILAGYSQGAQVISSALPDLPSEKILYAATFGDPKLYLPEGFSKEGTTAPACLELNLSNYRVAVPDCEVFEGILSATVPYQPAGFKDKLGTWCNLADFMCGSYFDFSDLIAPHLAYSADGSYSALAAKLRPLMFADLAARNLPQTPETPTPPEIEEPDRNESEDIAFLILNDRKTSRYYDELVAELRARAETVLSRGGRFALYTYNGTIYSPKKWLTSAATLADLDDFIDNDLRFPSVSDGTYEFSRAKKSVLSDLGWTDSSRLVVLSFATFNPDVILSVSAEIPVRYAVVVADAFLGFTTERNPTFTDVAEDTTARLIPIYTSGRRGDAIVYHLKKNSTTPKAPNSGAG